MRLVDMTDNIVEQYNLKEKAMKDGYIYVAIKRGMYGLPQASILAQDLLVKRLNKHGFTQSKYILGLWTHTWRPICFTLVVDEFGIKYEGREHADHLIGVVREHYNLTID